MPARVDGTAISFVLPDGKGQFRGTLNGKQIAGHWLGHKSEFNGTGYATPVTLEADGENRWRGQVAPLEETFTFYMPVTRRPDGTYSTYLRNPERNQGRFIPVSGIRLNKDLAELTGRRGNQADAVIAKVSYEDGVMRVPLRGSSGSAMRNLTRTQQYGWLWNSHEYSWKGRTVRGYFAGGNGGQVFMAIPELDLVIAFTGGSYGQAATFMSQREYMPRYVLPAID